MTRDADVIIIGGGPAGSMAGSALTGRGLRVLLLDKKRFPRDKPCGGGIRASLRVRVPRWGKSSAIAPPRRAGRPSCRRQKPCTAFVRNLRGVLARVPRVREALDQPRPLDVWCGEKVDRFGIPADERSIIIARVCRMKALS